MMHGQQNFNFDMLAVKSFVTNLRTQNHTLNVKARYKIRLSYQAIYCYFITPDLSVVAR